MVTYLWCLQHRPICTNQKTSRGKLLDTHTLKKLSWRMVVNKKELEDLIYYEIDEDILLMDGFEEAFIGFF
jgi:hypothetical protein